jgi:hypothetical protein
MQVGHLHWCAYLRTDTKELKQVVDRYLGLVVPPIAWNLPNVDLWQLPK